SIGLIIYLVIGVLIASARDYLGDVGSLGGVLNLVLAVLLWPLVLLGVKFNISFGGGDGKNKSLGLLLGAPLAYACASVANISKASKNFRKGSSRNTLIPESTKHPR
ncbi:MAG: hypothetical protein H0U53_07435, partial [Actinobacteria bacterium]|nr:hypothetical protein [Actinomycetota bacterium]